MSVRISIDWRALFTMIVISSFVSWASMSVLAVGRPFKQGGCSIFFSFTFFQKGGIADSRLLFATNDHHWNIQHYNDTIIREGPLAHPQHRPTIYPYTKLSPSHTHQPIRTETTYEFYQRVNFHNDTSAFATSLGLVSLRFFLFFYYSKWNSDDFTGKTSAKGEAGAAWQPEMCVDFPSTATTSASSDQCYH